MVGWGMINSGVHFLRNYYWMVLLLVFTCINVAEARNNRPKNIVFILVDDLRYDIFGFMGHPFIETPNIDALASEGVQFQNAFVTTSLCSPSRASFLTGQYMHHHKVVDNSTPIRHGTKTFPMYLQEAGYETAFIGKWHMGGSSDAVRPGFDHWVSFPGQGTYAPEKQMINVNGTRVPRTKYMTDELTDYAEDWLESRQGDQPFMLYLSHKGVHGLYDPAERHRDRYLDSSFQVPDDVATPPRANEQKPMWVQNQRNSWHGVDFPYYGRSGQSLEEMYRHYCEMILSIDDSVERVRATLRAGGHMHDTMIIFTSDGGHLWGEHGLIDKRCAYEPSMRIPLLVHAPGIIKSGIIVDALVANIDVAPTLLDLAGVDIPHTMDGQSFLPMLQIDHGVPADWRESLLYEYYWEPSFPMTPTTFALRGDRYKFIQYHGIWDFDELYDLETDPGEKNNLILNLIHRERVQQFRRQLYQTLKTTYGLNIPLGFKRNHGSHLRHPDGAPGAGFPSSMFRKE